MFKVPWSFKITGILFILKSSLYWLTFLLTFIYILPFLTSFFFLLTFPDFLPFLISYLSWLLTYPDFLPFLTSYLSRVLTFSDFFLYFLPFLYIPGLLSLHSDGSSFTFFSFFMLSKWHRLSIFLTISSLTSTFRKSANLLISLKLSCMENQIKREIENK